MAKAKKTKRPPVRRPIPAAKLSAPKRDKSKYHFGTLRGSDQAIQALLLSGQAAPDLMVELLPALLWLSHADGLPGNICVNGVMTLHHAYDQLGIVAQPRAVDLVVSNGRTGQRTFYGRPDPHWEGNVFHGHAILWLPRTHRFIDPTVEQYPEVRRYRLGPICGRSTGASTDSPEQRAALERGELPPGSHVGVQRKDLTLLYTAVAEQYTTAVSDAALVNDTADDYRRTGVNLASQALTLFRLPEIVDRIRQAPYPRLHALLDALGTAEPVVDQETGDFRFVLADPDSRSSADGDARPGELALRLDEVPLPDDLPDPASLPPLHQVAALPDRTAVRAATDPATVDEIMTDVRTEARTLPTGDRSTGGGQEPVVVFEPLRAAMARSGGVTTELQAHGIISQGFARFGPGRTKPPHLPGWSVRTTADGLELWDQGGLWARADHVPDADWLAAAHHGRVRVVYGVRTGVRLPEGLAPHDYTDEQRAAELLDSRRAGFVAIATVAWPVTT